MGQAMGKLITEGTKGTVAVVHAAEVRNSMFINTPEFFWTWYVGVGLAVIGVIIFGITLLVCGAVDDDDRRDNWKEKLNDSVDANKKSTSFTTWFNKCKGGYIPAITFFIIGVLAMTITSLLLTRATKDSSAILATASTMRAIID